VTHRLAVRLDSLGDVLVTGPAVRALAATSDRLTLLCGPRGRAAAELLPGVDEVICWEAPWIAPEPDPVDAGEVAALVTSFHQSALPTALALRLAGVPWVGAVSRDYPGSLLDLRLPEPGRVPEPEAQLRLALASGGQLPPGDEGRLQVRLGDQDRQPPFDGEPPRSPYVVLHPGTSVPARAWPVDHYRKVAGLLAAQGRQVVVTGAPGERDLTATVAAGPGTFDLGGRTDLAGLAAVLRGAEAVVVGNTGPAHLAAAVGTPVVSLFAPTVPAEVWAPYGVPVVLLGDQQAPCRESRAATCPVAGHPCLASVSPAEVLAAIRQVGGSERTADAGPAEQEVPVRRAHPEPALEGGACR
jgi:ADP-heptose:LPS heptosyltransferase